MKTFVNVLYSILGLFSTIYGLLIMFEVVKPPSLALIGGAAFIAIGNILIDVADFED